MSETEGAAMISKRKKLFGNNVEPACVYCKKGRPAPDGVMIHCRKYGPVAPQFKCKRYLYDPLKRVPPRIPKLREYAKEDFEL